MINTELLLASFPGLLEEEPESDAGELSILNCTAGDITIKFDKDDPNDVAQAKKMIQDMQRRGYIIFVQDGDKTKRVDGFDQNTNEYILKEPEPPKVDEFAETPKVLATLHIARKSKHVCCVCKKLIETGTAYYQASIRFSHQSCGEPKPAQKRRQKHVRRRLPLAGTKATAVAPTSGG